MVSALLDSWKWNVLDHPLHSSDLASSECHLFLHLKNHVVVKKIYDDNEVKDEVESTTWGYKAGSKNE